MFPITLLINAPNNLFWVTDSVVIKKTDLHIFLKKNNQELFVYIVSIKSSQEW